MPSDRGAVYRYDEKNGTVRQVAVFGYTPDEAQLIAETFTDSIAYEALRELQPVYVPDVSDRAAGLMAEEAGAGPRVTGKFMKALPQLKAAAAMGTKERPDPEISPLPF